jgi:hypothetical protein
LKFHKLKLLNELKYLMKFSGNVSIFLANKTENISLVNMQPLLKYHINCLTVVFCHTLYTSWARYISPTQGSLSDITDKLPALYLRAVQLYMACGWWPPLVQDIPSTVGG